MYLTDHGRLQLDAETLSRLGEMALRHLSKRIRADLKEAQDWLNQDSRNRSRPPSLDAPYGRRRGAASDRQAVTSSADEAIRALAKQRRRRPTTRRTVRPDRWLREKVRVKWALRPLPALGVVSLVPPATEVTSGWR